MRNPSLRLVCVAVVSCLAVAVPARASGPSISGVAVGFARVNLGDGSVAAFGGRGTRSVTTGPSGGTGLIVFFNGVYPKKLTSAQVVVQATAEASEADQFAVANGIVASAGNDQIVVTVNGWIAGTQTPVDGYVFVTVFAGEPPKE
jgi:hypothetical protein